jgi:translin
MYNLESIADAIRAEFEVKNTARDEAMARSRVLTRCCANAIRAVHREMWDEARQGLETARSAAQELSVGVRMYPDLYYSGYTQDALKEYVEAVATYALVRGEPLPSPETLDVPSSTYLNGLAEAASELRRTILDIIRRDHHAEAERLLETMDAIYDTLMTFDFPDALTGGLRHRVDALRGVLERTRGDLTNSLRQQRLMSALSDLEQHLGLTAMGNVALDEAPSDEEG